MDAIKELFELDFSSLILGTFIIMSGIIAIYNIVGKFSEIIGKPFKWVKRKNADHETIIRLEEEMKKYTENRIKDREQSFKIQKELVDAQTKISNSVSDIVKKIDEFKKDTNERFSASAEKENKRVQAEIKDKIAQLYRQYNLTKSINGMELEALEDLISTYEEHGGENSFIHSVVQKEMYTWKIY